MFSPSSSISSSCFASNYQRHRWESGHVRLERKSSDVLKRSVVRGKELGNEEEVLWWRVGGWILPVALQSECFRFLRSSRWIYTRTQVELLHTIHMAAVLLNDFGISIMEWTSNLTQTESSIDLFLPSLSSCTYVGPTVKTSSRLDDGICIFTTIKSLRYDVYAEISSPESASSFLLKQCGSRAMAAKHISHWCTPTHQA